MIFSLSNANTAALWSQYQQQLKERWEKQRKEYAENGKKTKTNQNPNNNNVGWKSAELQQMYSNVNNVDLKKIMSPPQSFNPFQPVNVSHGFGNAPTILSSSTSLPSMNPLFATNPLLSAGLAAQSPRGIIPPTDNNRFLLMEQPGEIQRKSYSHENRCLKPSPLVVKLGEKVDSLVDGTVSVALVNNEYQDLRPDLQQSLVSVDQSTDLCVPLQNNKASVYLKLRQTSGGKKWRLRFTVRYHLGASEIEEVFYSEPFAVYSNVGPRKKN